MSDAGIVERVRELRPLIRENAVRAERARRVPDEVVAALTGTGVHRMNVPRRYGGYQTPLHTQIDAFTEIAVECASTAWVTLGQAGVSYIAALFPDEAQDDFFTGPSGPDVRIGGTLVPGATVVPCDGGYRVDGASGFATGCHHADWHLLTAAVAPADGRPQEGPPEMLWVAVPMSELEILDDWDVTGLAATGSNTVVARNIPVPAHRVLPVGPMLAGWTPSKANADDPFYRMPVLLLFCAWAASAALGLGRAAMTEFTGRIHRRGITYTFHERQNEATDQCGASVYEIRQERAKRRQGAVNERRGWFPRMFPEEVNAIDLGPAQCVGAPAPHPHLIQELTMADVAFVVTTIALFALVALVAKGVTKL
ncbi:acyl-CoA dehydrogenase family protein [Streptomyces aurantiacus]|nr:acyl-CoA dehydrogenase family protein [Streptomyces aurantiacus]